MKLSKANDAIAFLDDPVEQQKSYISSTVAASSDLAPSTLLELNMFSWPGLILILPSLPHAICAYIYSYCPGLSGNWMVDNLETLPYDVGATVAATVLEESVKDWWV